MMRAFAHLSFRVALLSGLAFAQSTETKPAFEIADVRVSPPTRNPFLRGPSIRRGRYEVRVATMVDLISKAYAIDAERVLGGPSWLENDRFDVIAKAPAESTVETAKPMLQELLAERFKLVVHNDTKSIPAYALKAGKHPQLKEADGSGDPGCKFIPPAPSATGGPPPGLPILSYSCRNMTMAAFANALHTSIILGSQFLNDRVVVDETGLKGAWQFDFKYTPPPGRMGPAGVGDSGAITLFDAIEKQLGLKLDPMDAPLPVIVVDKVNQTPTANLPDAAESLHIASAPTEFEVATIRPTDPDFRGMRLQMQPGGRVNIGGVPLKFLMEQAWDLTDEMLVGIPKWMETDRFDIVAKATVAGGELDIDSLWPMLRALVTERFKLATHTEERTVTAYTLVAVKPKMKKADPASRTKYKEGPAADGKDPRNKNPVLGRLVTCQNMTMAQFAERLKNIAPGYIQTPVLDSTGLEGAYDFTLSFSPAGATRAGGGEGRGGGESAPPPPGGASGSPSPGSSSPGSSSPGNAPGQSSPGSAPVAASDPNGAVTLFQAIERQLGLKLETQKRPVPVLVIDHVEQKPVEN
jgi:uncharacterized protein (TIGR03435 family)